MAITNAQQFKQLVNPPMKGRKRPGYRGDDAYGGGTTAGGSRSDSPGDRGDGPSSAERARDFGGVERERRMGTLGKAMPGRNPMAQFSGDVDTTDLTFMDQARRSVNPLGVLTEVPGGIGLLARILSPNPFRPRPKIRDFVGRQDEADDSQIVLPIMPDQAPSITEDEEDPFQLSRRFRADGGIMNSNVVGGEFDFESARQMYGLGKLVKKVTRTVKKIAKSPVGKAAILAATYKLGGGKAFGGEGFKFSNLPGLGFLKPASTSVGAQAAAVGLSPREFMMGIGGKTATSGGIFSSIPGGALTAGIVGTSALAGLLTPEEETEAEELSRGEGIDIEAARNAILAARQDDFRARRFRAEGGRIEYQEGSKEPVAKKTMPLLDLDGKEMDLREEGGFVPIGRMEKADDVPARLSKNEFVFTADAVRNAGDGNVDKGAEVMYNMMKNLEAGGDVSKESQGLQGARKMFQTSQRLEEVL